MPRNRKISEKQVNFDLSKDVIDRLNEYCEREGFKKKSIVELAILRLLNQREKNLER